MEEKATNSEESSQGTLVHANNSNFDSEVLKATGIVVVDFWASWCGPCITQGPIFEEAAAELSDKAKFVKVQLDDGTNPENQTLAGNFGVMSIPTLVFFKDGAEADRTTGVMQKEQILEKLDELSSE